MITLIDAVMICLVIVIGFLAYVLRTNDKQLTWFKSSANRPLTYHPISDGKNLNTILQIIPYLNITEQQIVFAKAFGSAVDIGLTVNTDGQMIFRHVILHEKTPDEKHEELTKVKLDNEIAG